IPETSSSGSSPSSNKTSSCGTATGVKTLSVRRQLFTDEKSASQPFHLDVPTSPSENLAAVASSQQESAGSRQGAPTFLLAIP
ncbi:unnamed protein product, partial [Tenebrio molitor]